MRTARRRRRRSATRPTCRRKRSISTAVAPDRRGRRGTATPASLHDPAELPGIARREAAARRPHRGSAPRGAGSHRPGRQGAARHQGRPLTCHVTIPGRFLVFMPTVDHLGVSRKIEARGARPPSRHRPGISRGAWLHRRSDRPHRRRRPTQGRHRRRSRLLPPGLAGNPAPDRNAPSARRAISGAESGRQAAPGPADRGLRRDPARQPARAPAHAGPGLADDAERSRR